MADTQRFESGLSLGEALRGLPLESPARSAWPAMAKRIDRPQRSSRSSHWPLAIAASLLALLLMPREVPNSSPRPLAGAALSVASQRVELAALMSESARLERVVAAASDDGASSATAAAWSLELEDRLQTLDGELEGNRNPVRQLALWQQRVQLLRDVAEVETSRHYLASQGRSFDVALVSAY